MQINIDTSRIQRKFEENPALMMAAAGTLFAGAAKLMNANTSRKNSTTWKREVRRRERK